MPMMPNRMSAPGKSKRGIAGVLKEVFRYSEKLKVPVAVALLFAVLGAILTIIGPNLLSQITDLISNALQAEIDLAAIGRIGALLLLLYLCSAVFTYVEHYIMATVTLDLSRDMRQDLSRKINRVPMRYFSKVSYGDILSRVTNDVSTGGRGRNGPGLPRHGGGHAPVAEVLLRPAGKPRYPQRLY